jgi:hypothetical protein
MCSFQLRRIALVMGGILALTATGCCWPYHEGRWGWHHDDRRDERHEPDHR